MAGVAETLDGSNRLKGTERIAEIATNVDKNDGGRMIRQCVDGQFLERCDRHSLRRGGRYKSSETVLSAEDR